MKKERVAIILDVVKFILTLGLSHIAKWFSKNNN